MSMFSNRRRNVGYIQIGGAKALVVKCDNGFLALYQTHAKGTPLPVAAYSVDGSTGILSTTNGLTAIPQVSDCVILPETCELFDAIRVSDADLASKILTICPQCSAQSPPVTLVNFDDACDSCIANYNTIADLKTPA